MDALLAYNVVVDECFKFSITMLLNSTIMLVIVLHYASICSYASILLLCSKLCQHNLPRPNKRQTWGDTAKYLDEVRRCLFEVVYKWNPSTTDTIGIFCPL